MRNARTSLRSIHRHLAVTAVLAIGLLGGLGGWAATSELAGAVIAPGVLVVESNVKKVQHPVGGVVSELNVKDGDFVHAGDVVAKLDDTQTRANLDIITKQLDELTARKARLDAEKNGDTSVQFPRGALGATRRCRCINTRLRRAKAVRVATGGPRGSKSRNSASA